MDTPGNVEAESLQHLENMERELGEIRERTANPKRYFFVGIAQGAGAIVGGIIAVVIIGWILSIFGVIPGFKEIAASIHDAMQTVREK